jgi:hypothetical protein
MTISTRQFVIKKTRSTGLHMFTVSALLVGTEYQSCEDTIWLVPAKGNSG